MTAEPLTPAQRECAKFITAKFARNAAGENLTSSELGWRWADDHPIAIVDEETVINLGDFVSTLLEISWALMLDLSYTVDTNPDDLIQNLALSIADA